MVTSVARVAKGVVGRSWLKLVYFWLRPATDFIKCLNEKMGCPAALQGLPSENPAGPLPLFLSNT